MELAAIVLRPLRRRHISTSIGGIAQVGLRGGVSYRASAMGLAQLGHLVRLSDVTGKGALATGWPGAAADAGGACLLSLEFRGRQAGGCAG